jgi:hypothetical protein
MTDVPAGETKARPAASVVVPKESRKATAGQASISEAIQALWPNGIPQGIQVQQRDDQIIDWQRRNNLTIVSPKSISRYLSRDTNLQ